jgi:hypothetical protein
MSPLRAHSRILRIAWAQLVGVIHGVLGDVSDDDSVCGSFQLLALLGRVGPLPMSDDEYFLAMTD